MGNEHLILRLHPAMCVISFDFIVYRTWFGFNGIQLSVGSLYFVTCLRLIVIAPSGAGMKPGIGGGGIDAFDDFIGGGGGIFIGGGGGHGGGFGGSTGLCSIGRASLAKRCQ